MARRAIIADNFGKFAEILNSEEFGKKLDDKIEQKLEQKVEEKLGEKLNESDKVAELEQRVAQLEQKLAEVEKNDKSSGTIFLRLKDVLLSVAGFVG